MKDWNDITLARAFIVVFIAIVLIGLLSGCYPTYYLSDSEYSDAREEHASITYYQGNVYWGWHSGYYYYYGTPHYYPWYYYYNSCPPSHYGNTTHIIITKPVNKPTHRPNRPKNNNNRIYIKPNKNHNTNPNKVIINKNRNTNNTKVKTNRSNTKVKTNRRPK
jgi:hypothetical protein